MVDLKRASGLLTQEHIIQPAIDFLIKEGMPVDRMRKLIIFQPRTMLHKHERMVCVVNYLKNLGLQPEDTVFTRALNAMLCVSESTTRKKIEVMKSLGWSEEKIWVVFKRFPSTLTYSEKKITESMDFLINTMGLERQILIVHPALLGFSTEKGIRPRYNVMKVLESKELLLFKGEKNIAALLTISEKKFLKDYVTKYVDEVPGLLEIYGGSGKAKKKAI